MKINDYQISKKNGPYIYLFIYLDSYVFTVHQLH